jgi:uncharacterized protein (DUF3084 family)
MPRTTIPEETADALNLYITELEKLKVKYEKKRETELARQAQKIHGCADEYELANLYGWGNITRKEYEAALNKLRGLEDAKTAASELLRMVSSDIRDLRTEFAELSKK